jgi:hypothetical protein
MLPVVGLLLPAIALIRSIQTAVGWLAIDAGAPEATALARHCALLYTPAPAYGLSTRLQFGGVHVGPDGPPVVVGGRLVVVVGGREVVVVGGRLVVVVGGREVVVVGGRLVVVLVGGEFVPPPHVTPLMVNDAGAGVSVFMLGWVPVQVPRKPGLICPPVPTVPFQLSFWTVAFDPLAVHRPFQPWLTVPLGSVNVIVQFCHASPVFVTIN